MKPAIVFIWSILLCLANQTHACNYSFDPCSANMYRLDLTESCGENRSMRCKTAQTSSFSTGYTSDNAVDGSSTTCSKPVFSLTDSWWWRVDLHEFRNVQNLSLVFDDSQTASNFSIYINNSTRHNNSDFLGMLCANRTILPGTKQTDVSCDRGGLVGRFVHVVFPQSVISLCEIEVFETKCRKCPQNMVVKDCRCPLNITVVSVDVFTKITPISHNTAILRYIVMLSICISTLIVLSVLCKFYFPDKGPCSVLTLMRIKAKNYTPIV